VCQKANKTHASNLPAQTGHHLLEQDLALINKNESAFTSIVL
jgi:hypothetical protein